MAIIIAQKLKVHETITDLRIGTTYLGKVLPNKTIALSENARLKPINPEILTEQKEVAVKITKINLPYNAEGEIQSGEYEVEEETANIGEFNLKDIGASFVIYAKVEKTQQTSGPTLFTLFDGTGTIIAKSFVGPGKRAFPELLEGSYIRAEIRLNERDNIIESELKTYKSLTASKEERIAKKINDKLEEEAKPTNTQFLIQSEILNKLSSNFVKAATEIKRAILESRPIIIRHHADCDGYSGAVALERAIIPLIEQKNDKQNSAWKLFSRAPSKTPFYDDEDAIKDVAGFLSDQAKYCEKEPLIILLDNGSTQEDLPGIKRARVFKAKIIIVDHHYTKLQNGKTCVDPYIDAHINPYLVEGDKNLTAGMLGTELALMINPKAENLTFIPALAGTADRSEGIEYNKYLELSEKIGLNKEKLAAMAKIIDYEAHKLRYMEAREYVDVLFSPKTKEHETLLKILIQEVNEANQKVLPVIQHFSKIEERKGVAILSLDLDKISFRDSYPPAGKLTGITHDFYKEKYPRLVSLGLTPTAVTIRATGVEGFNINTIIENMEKELPWAQISGGGHENAGTIKFVEGAKEEVLKKIIEKIELVS